MSSSAANAMWLRRRLIAAIDAVDAIQADGETWNGPDLDVTRAFLKDALDDLGPGTARPLGHWTRDRVIAAIQEFARRYDRLPRAIDWNVSMARAHGRDDLADRFYADCCWPHASNVYGHGRPFAAWNEAIAAAGFEPRQIGKYDRSQTTA